MKIGGLHILMDFSDCNEDLNDKNFINQLIKDIASFCNLNIINTLTHNYKPQGITALALISESHISIHTWPEKSFCSIDVYTRSEKGIKHFQLKNLLEEWLEGQCEMVLIKRERGKIKVIDTEN